MFELFLGVLIGTVCVAALSLVVISGSWANVVAVVTLAESSLYVSR